MRDEEGLSETKEVVEEDLTPKLALLKERKRSLRMEYDNVCKMLNKSFRIIVEEFSEEDQLHYVELYKYCRHIISLLLNVNYVNMYTFDRFRLVSVDIYEKMLKCAYIFKIIVENAAKKQDILEEC